MSRGFSIGQTWRFWTAMAFLLASVLCSSQTEAQYKAVGWGVNSDGRLGDGTSIRRLRPVEVVSRNNFAKISSGGDHTVALKSDGTLWAWGRNYGGWLGDGTTNDQNSPVQVLGLSEVIDLATGNSHTIALRADGTVWTWGWNYYGQLGDGGMTDRSAPAQVMQLSGVIQVEAAGDQTIALKSDGTVWAWGDGSGRGNGTGINNITPAQMIGLTEVTSVAGGPSHVFALKLDRTVWAWGNNGYGQLGDGTTDDYIIPVQVSGLNDVVSIATGGYDLFAHSVAAKSDGTVWVWGSNLYGQLGDGTTANRPTPVQVTGLSGITAVSAGYFHTAVLKSNGAMWTWGLNRDGVLGDGTMTTRYTPVSVVGIGGSGVLGRVVKISAGDFHTMALLDTSVLISGTVTLNGLATSAPAQTVSFAFRDGNGATQFTRSANIDASGVFSFSIPSGNYTVHLSANRYLSTNVTLNATGSATNLNAILKVGDATGDNVVDISDLLLLIAHYNQVSSVGNYLEAVDFNFDGANDITDLLLLIANYNQMGD